MTEGFPNVELKGLRIHFIAIGGIGMSALARIAAARGAVVSGCDSSESPILDDLRNLGCTCVVGHSATHLDNVDVVVYSSAVPRDTPEMKAALGRGLKVVSRGRMLAWLQRGSDTIAVAGAHGKTTTTWIVANVLMRCGLDPSVAVGGIVPDLKGNARTGSGRFFVTEADESDGSFLHLVPKYPVITNVDADHLDYYGDLEAIKQAFIDFGNSSTEGGAVVACANCPNIAAILDKIDARKVTYGIGKGEVNAQNLRFEPLQTTFDVRLPSGRVHDVMLSLPGVHNVLNSLAALALADELDLPINSVREALANTSSVGRRLERRGAQRGITVYDDYAHHPTEIKAMLEAARRLTSGQLVGVFQPHRYSRTQHLHKEFGAVFDRLDRLIVAPIYAASEPPIEGVTSDLIVREVSAQGKVECETVGDLAEVPDRLVADLQSGDVVITIGAGNVWQAGDALLQAIRLLGREDIAVGALEGGEKV